MWTYISGIIIIASIDIIAVLGLAVFTGFTGMFSWGHAAFMAIGAYTAAICTHFLHLNFYLALLLGGMTALLISFVIGIPTLRVNMRSDYFAIATLGFGEAVKIILQNLGITNGARGLPGIPSYTKVWNILLILALFIYLTANFINSKFGRRAVAIREDFVAAEMAGINLYRVRLLSLAYSAFTAGVAGGLMAHYMNFVQPSMFTGVLSTLLTCAVVAGGMGSITGPVIAMALFASIPEVLRMAEMWRMVIYGLVLVLIIILRPQGIFGYKELTPAYIRSVIKNIREKKAAKKKAE